MDLKEETKEFVKELYANMMKQDRRCTASPYYYTIQEDHVNWIPAYNQTDAYSYDGEMYDEDELAEHEINKDDCEEWEKIVSHRYKGVFLTEEACERHIRNNKHHYNNPHSYIEYGFRNPELMGIIDLVKELGEQIS
jgi:hypothetical protein